MSMFDSATAHQKSVFYKKISERTNFNVKAVNPEKRVARRKIEDIQQEKAIHDELYSFD